MNVECPNCGLESAYHNGVCYVCPDCDYEWDDGLNLYKDEDDIDLEESIEEYPPIEEEWDGSFDVGSDDDFDDEFDK